MTNSLQLLSITHASEVVEAEQRLLGAGFRYPDELLLHANKYELCGNDFAIPVHCYVFCVLIECALRALGPTLKLIHDCLCAVGYSPRLDAKGYPLELASLLLFTEVVPTGIARNVEIVATFARRRREAQRRLRQIKSLLLGDLEWLKERTPAEEHISVMLPPKRGRRRP